MNPRNPLALWQNFAQGKTCRDSGFAMMRGLRPPTLGTSIESSSGIIEVSAQPCFFLIFSASVTPVRRATATSFVKCSPPMGSTAVCQSEKFVSALASTRTGFSGLEMSTRRP